MPLFDKTKFAETLNANAESGSTGRCANFVRRALEAAGLNTTGHPLYAKDWGPTLERMAFKAVPKDQSYVATIGDVVVLQPPKDRKEGHIAGFDGKKWISDFVQTDMWAGPAYRKEQPPYEIYRNPL